MDTQMQLWHHARVFSFGGGVQSTAVMAAQARGLLVEPYDAFVWADVGADSENPDTIAYIQDIIVPFCRVHDINFYRCAKTRYGAEDTVLQSIIRNNRSIPAPFRMSSGSPGRRTCTSDFKIRVVDRWIAGRGYSHVTIGLGFSIDESKRAIGKLTSFHDCHGKYKFGFLKRFDFPLFDISVSRDKCHGIITDAGLPVPPKSSCWFCPFTSRGEWIERKKYNVDMVQNAAIVEAITNKKRSALGRDNVYIHPPTGGSMHTLASAIGDQMSLFEETCDSGYCGL